MPRRAVPLTLLCLLVFAGGGDVLAAPADKESKKDLKRAESILSKLRRLGDASATETADPNTFVKAARKLYPELFSKVSELREGGLKTELTTAVVLYESSLRAARQGGAPDCTRELRETYVRICFEMHDSGRAAFLRAKARLHARRAEAELLYARGERGAATLAAVSLIRAERDTDRALAGDALLSLKELVTSSQSEEKGSRAAFDLSGRLEAIDRVLASLPRDRSHQLLCEARDAFRDGLYWQHKAAPALALVIDTGSFTPRGELPRIGLRADDATRIAQANLRAALKFINRAEEELAEARP